MHAALSQENSVSHPLTGAQDDSTNFSSPRQNHEDLLEAVTDSDRYAESNGNILVDSHEPSYKTPPTFDSEIAPHRHEHVGYDESLLQPSHFSSGSGQDSTPSPFDGGGDHQMPQHTTKANQSNQETRILENGSREETISKLSQNDALQTTTKTYEKFLLEGKKEQNSEQEKQKRGEQKKHLDQTSNSHQHESENAGKRRHERNLRSSFLDTKNMEVNQNDVNISDAVQIHSYSFNQDHSCFVCATTGGIRVYTCKPLCEFLRREWGNGGCRVAGMLYRTSVFAIVSAAESKKIKLWNEQKQRFIGELRCRQAVKNVCLGRDILAMVTEYTIYVYQSEEMRPFSVINTGANSKGLCVVSSGPDKDEWKVACPAVAVGAVRVQTSEGERTSHVFQAHQSVLAAMAFNFQGTMVVTASEIGTVIRVFSSCDGQLLHEFRRGTHSNVISCVAFRQDNNFLAVASTSCTVHIFKLEKKENFYKGFSSKNETNRTDSHNKGVETSLADTSYDSSNGGNISVSIPGTQIHSAINVGKEITSVVYDASKEIVHDALKGVLPRYFSAARSFAQFHIPGDHQSIDMRSTTSAIVGPLCAFSGDIPNNLYLVHHNGLLYEIQFNPIVGEECTLLTSTTWFAPRRDFQIHAHLTSSLPSDLEGGHDGDDWQLVM